MNETNIKNSFDALFEVSQKLHSILDPTTLLDTILEIAIRHLDAERGFIVLCDPTVACGYRVVHKKNFSSEKETSQFAASSSVLRQVLETGEAVLSFDALTDERFESSKSIIMQQILSILCIPLRTRDVIIGAVYVDSRKSRRAFTEESQKFLSVFGVLAALALENAKKFTELKDENERLRSEVTVTHRFQGIVGESKAWRHVLELVEKVSVTDVSVLITGESGTGKELIARAIHTSSSRSKGNFVAINCSAIPEHLLESELFGYKRGAFTGAVRDKAGLFEIAHGGTLFLDEISELPLPLQAKILRVVQDHEIRRVGEVDTRKVDVRILAATNKNLSEEVKKGRFREDLFFRLNVVCIALPPLRNRRDDIPLLAHYFFTKACESHKRTVHSISPQAIQKLLLYSWPGNVRELQNVIERAVVLCKGDTITADDIVLDTPEPHLSSGCTLEEYERRIIEATLHEMGGNRTRTAEKLGVSLRWLQYRLKEWNNE